MKINYYEKVVVVSSDRFPDYVGRTGVVLGISEENNRIYSYSVFFPDEDDGVSFFPENLKGSGKILERSEFYEENDRIHVRVEGDEGIIDE